MRYAPASRNRAQSGRAEVAEQIAAYPWQSERCVVVPYSPGKFPPGYLHDSVVRLESEGALAWIFPGDDLQAEAVESRIAGRLVLLGLTKPDHHLAGVGFLWNTEGRQMVLRAEIGFAFFRRYWATRLIRDIARIGVQLAYHETGADRLVGTILADNLPSRAFAAEIGFEELAVLKRWVPTPSGFRDAAIVARDRKAAEDGTAERTILREEHGR